MADFVRRDSIVRTIWGNGDVVLLVFAGSAAEFALNRAVDWLFFTGKIPADPIGRLFATAGYAQHIVFADDHTASRTFERIRAVHGAVENQRGQRIPDWAHRDVLYMLIDYSERAHELLVRPLSGDERAELYDVFHRVGIGLGIPDLPSSYDEWRRDRDHHLRRDLAHGDGTAALYAIYRAHLGLWRYGLLRRIQSILVPSHVRGLLRMTPAEWLRPLVRFYPTLVRAGLRSLIQRLLMPSKYLAAVRGLDQAHPPLTSAECYRSGRGSIHRHHFERPTRNRSRSADDTLQREPSSATSASGGDFATTNLRLADVVDVMTLSPSKIDGTGRGFISRGSRDGAVNDSGRGTHPRHDA